MAVSAKRGAVRATTTFHAPDNVTINQGDVLAGDDPIARKYASFFVSADELTRAPVVTATARPGESR